MAPWRDDRDREFVVVDRRAVDDDLVDIGMAGQRCDDRLRVHRALVALDDPVHAAHQPVVAVDVRRTSWPASPQRSCDPNTSRSTVAPVSSR